MEAILFVVPDFAEKVVLHVDELKYLAWLLVPGENPRAIVNLSRVKEGGSLAN